MADRLTIFLPSLSGGGAEKTFVLLANWFVRAGIPVDLLLIQREGPYLADLHEDVHVFGSEAPPRLVPAVASVLRHLERRRPTALVSSLNAPNLLGPTLGRLHRLARFSGRRPKVIVSQQVSISMDSAHSPSPRARHFPTLAKRLFPLADAVVAASHGVRDDLIDSLGLPPSSVRVIFNPVDLAGVEARSRERLDDPWVNAEGPPVVVGVGRLHPQKDFPSLIHAVASLHRQGRAVRLLILGEGPERKRLEALARELGIADSVRLPGFVANPFAYVRRADVFALSSRWEGFGNVVVEALAVGTPVVSTDCPSGPAEILEGGRHGRLVPPENSEALARAIASTLDQLPPEESLRARARRFSLDRVGSEWLNLVGLGAEDTSSRAGPSCRGGAG